MLAPDFFWALARPEWPCAQRALMFSGLAWGFRDFLYIITLIFTVRLNKNSSESFLTQNLTGVFCALLEAICTEPWTVRTFFEPILSRAFKATIGLGCGRDEL